MESFSGPALVLRRQRHLDYDFRLTLLVRDAGKLLAVLKGGQRPTSKLRALVEPFSEIDVQLFAPPHGVNARLAGGKLVNSHRELRMNMPAFEVASRACEVVDAMLPFRAPAPEVFDILRRSLHALPRAGAPPIVWVFFVVSMLRTLGHGDVSERALGLLQPVEREEVGHVLESGDAGDLSTVSIGSESLERCLAYVDAELDHVLPRRLKSAAFTTNPEEIDSDHP